MTPRERVTAAVAHEQPDQVPCDDSFWDDALIRFHQEGMPQDVSCADFFDFDIEHMNVDASPRLPERMLDDGEDRMSFVSKHGYSCTKWKHKSGALHYFDHVTPTHEDWDRVKKRMVLDADGTARISRQSYFPPFVTFPTWAEAAEEYRQARATDRYITLGFYGPWEATWRHHGYVETCMDIVTEPDWIGDMMKTFVDLVCDVIQKGLDCGIRPDAIYLIEDLGTTHATLFSPETYRRVVKPCHAQIFELGRRHGLACFMHSDGKIHDIMDDLVEIGVEVLNPIDLGSDMDPLAIKERYGDRLTIYGGISGPDMQDAAKSNAELETKVPALSKGGGFIFHSDHSVPATCSLTRYQAILRKVREMTHR